MGMEASGVDAAAFASLQNKVNSMQGQVNSLNDLQGKFDSLSTAAAGSIDHTKVADEINKQSNYRENLAKAIAKNPNELGANLATEIGKNTTIIQL